MNLLGTAMVLFMEHGAAELPARERPNAIRETPMIKHLKPSTFIVDNHGTTVPSGRGPDTCKENPHGIL